MAITGIDHIEIIVNDVKAHVEFYQKMGFELLRWTDHHGGSAELALPIENAFILEIHEVLIEEVPGVNHISWRCDDIDTTYKELAEKGLPFTVAPRAAADPAKSHTGRKNAEARDPGGFRVQFSDSSRTPVRERETA